jgi:ectoine hydroxylase-related dioxygenase (phytanoyl-CoA dioxygenase family)
MRRAGRGRFTDCEGFTWRLAHGEILLRLATTSHTASQTASNGVPRRARTVHENVRSTSDVERPEKTRRVQHAYVAHCTKSSQGLSSG